MTFEEVISRFEVKSRYKNRVQAVCPAHPDKQASLTITRGRTGTLIHCHAGCQIDDILAAVGLKKSDLFYENKTQGSSWQRYVEAREKRQIEAIYHYVDCNGAYMYTKIRLQGKKLLYGILKNDRFQYGLQGQNRRDLKALYFNPTALKQAILEGKNIYYCEGEKDCDCLTKRGYVALTAGGVNDWQSCFSDILKDADVVILSDNDLPGKQLASRVEADLKGVAQSVKVIIPTPDLPKGDVSDYFAAGHSNEDFETLIKESVTDTVVGGPIPVKNSTVSKSTLVNQLVKLNAAQKFATNDKGSAELFSTVFRNVSRYNPTQKDWMYYNGVKWIADTEGMKAKRNAKKLADAILSYGRLGRLTHRITSRGSSCKIQTQAKRGNYCLHRLYLMGSI